MHLRRLLITVVALAVMAAAQAPAPPKDPATVLDRSIHNAESEFVSLAEEMPDAKYNFKPTEGEFKDVRTFGEQVRHVATSNYMFGAMMIGEKPPVEEGKNENGPELKTKAEIIKQLKDSFAYLHRASAMLKADNLVEQVGPPEWRPTRLGLSMLMVAHVMDHYGQMVEYARMNNIVPPASRQQQAPPQPSAPAKK